MTVRVCQNVLISEVSTTNQEAISSLADICREDSTVDSATRKLQQVIKGRCQSEGDSRYNVIDCKADGEIRSIPLVKISVHKSEEEKGNWFTRLWHKIFD